MNLSRLYRRTLHKPLKVYWWRYDYPEMLNFGDEITPAIIDRLFGFKSVWAAPSECDLAGAGSIIEILQQLSGDNPIDVWGSGFIKPGPMNPKSNLIFHAVRGKKSLERTGNKGIVMGDPGVLTALAYPEVKTTTKKYKLGVIPHYVDHESPLLDKYRNKPDTIIINALWPVHKVVSAIASCELILSSSLHGLIVSDSLGVPNYWMPLSDKLTGGNYKFNDYYSIYDEKPKPLTIMNQESLDVERIITAYRPKTALRDLQDRLIKAFPFS